MGRPKGTKNKEFTSLPEGFQDAIIGSTTDEIRRRISDIALLSLADQIALKDDGDVQSAKESLKNLMEPYLENRKSFRQQIAFCKRVLDDKGGGKTVEKPVVKSN